MAYAGYWGLALSFSFTCHDTLECTYFALFLLYMNAYVIKLYLLVVMSGEGDLIIGGDLYAVSDNTQDARNKKGNKRR